MSYSTSRRETNVLLADDDAGIRDLYALWLAQAYDVTAVGTGDEAIETLDDEFDIVVLDRKFAEWKGTELLAELRKCGYEQPTIMISGVEPDTDIIDIPVDKYLAKPISEDELLDTVSLVLQLRSYDDLLQEYYSLISKRFALQQSNVIADVRARDEYAELEDCISSLEHELEMTRERFGEDDYRTVFERVVG